MDMAAGVGVECHQTVFLDQANGSGIQRRTLINLLMAWVLTLPAAMLLAGSLYWVLHQIF